MFNKLKKFLKSKRAVGSVATAIKVGTACVLGATVLVGGVALTQDVVLPNTSDKVQNVAEYEGDGAGGGSTGGVTPVSVPALNPLSNHSGVIPEGGIYYNKVGVSMCDVCLFPFNSTEPSTCPCGKYVNHMEGAYFYEGDVFPDIKNEDRYEYGDYKYTYSTSDSGWSSIPKDKTKSSYGPLLESINGYPLISVSFEGCETLVDASNIVIPDSVRTLGFQNCINLTFSSGFPAGITDISSTYFRCFNLVAVPEIPSGVTKMGNICCGCSSLTDVPTIPSSIDNISDAFVGCSSLTEITYAGTIAQWNSIPKNKKSNFNQQSSITVIHCSDGDIEVN